MTAPTGSGGALAVLDALQFGFRNRCPICAGFNVGPNGETDRAHTRDCPVPTAIQTVEAMAEALEEWDSLEAGELIGAEYRAALHKHRTKSRAVLARFHGGA